MFVPADIKNRVNEKLRECIKIAEAKYNTTCNKLYG